MLTALIHNRIVSVDDYSSIELKELSREKQIFCVECEELLVFRECSDRQHHFSHYHSDCSYPFREAESVEHASGKQHLKRWTSYSFGKNDCVLERKIPETNQRADLFIESLSTAIEFQCSVIQEDTWKTRHNLYQSAGICDLWILGYSMHRYQSSAHRFAHKLSNLERAIYDAYGKIVYFDTLTQHFVFLHPDTITKGFAIGAEYRFKLSEVSIQNGTLKSRYDLLTSNQQQRFSYALEERKKAAETDRFISASKKEVTAAKTLASSKQVNYIQHLLMQKNMKIPYKFHGMLKDEAATIIKKLLSDQTG